MVVTHELEPKLILVYRRRHDERRGPLVALPFFRRLHQTGSRTRLGLATVGAVAAAAIIATGLYRLWGNPAGLAVNAPSIAKWPRRLHIPALLRAMRMPRQ